ncbi:uncharacterized protein LOC129222742 [Uloborus diversus]|uniref:uncharacterized protein LOC129222742 n=1 Tax=Uloborus diversus TaxID=327109 RepID=UPI002409D6BC|nr:uncharacterized protein LOC129222742 [Uloborus diversus]
MGSSVLMYVIPMMLGSTYHLGKDQPGVQIFPETAIKNAMRIENHYTDSQYRMVENAEEIRNFLDIDGRLSLKIKAGLVNVGGEGKYLKDSSSKSNALEILIKVHFETMTETLPTWLSPSPGWNSMDSKVLGTHYCRSITYGGDLVASVRITASSKQDQQKIRGAFEGGVHTSGGGFGLDLKGKLEMLQASGQDDSSIEIEYYASVPLNGVPHTVDGLIELVDDFPSHVKGVNGGMGNPIKMELYPLNSLLSGYPPYLQDRALTDELDDLEAHFDDLTETRRQFKLWLAALPPDAPEHINAKLLAFSTKLNAVYAVYLRTITELDISKGASTDPIRVAFEAYKDGEYLFPHKYSRKLKALQKEIYQKAPELLPRIGGANYIHWGRKQCPSNTETVLSGVTIGSEVGQNGSSSDFLCSEKILEERDGFEQLEDVSRDRALISSLKYQGKLQKFFSMAEKSIACSHCRSSRKSRAMMFAARTDCPEDWTKEYGGYLMAPSLDSSKGEYICVDEEMEEAADEVTTVPRIVPIQLTEVSSRCGSLPCDSFENSKLMSCVVCSI